MEASETSGQENPGQEPGQDPAPAQEQATQDSNLTTEQPDQPAPTEAERQTSDAAPEETAPPVQDQSADEPGVREAPRGVERPPARDQVAEEAQRQAELDAQRQEHNERTGGGQAPADTSSDNAESAGSPEQA